MLSVSSSTLCVLDRASDVKVGSLLSHDCG